MHVCHLIHDATLFMIQLDNYLVDIPMAIVISVFDLYSN